MIHKSNLGGYGDDAEQYADIDGYIPQAGDKHENMNWDAMTVWDDDSWAEHVSAAVAATAAAEEAIADWQTA